ncbi:SgcJ/EcaC family oxidoreductase [Saccharothrix violaceirubra]|uniref:Uncharacterized protein (TIGR02246 family) n=1 Tax=Saccharothrix violaceirubra TaxID=413306 RepID=A0A7W7T4X4_9PSEU|nr:SgcJ/EcaC family oxidoreductase [Saccharothrix violaceirubra]MBB4966659.1 uncharacterized protein (TIGR02246 family) [Saccharothrix violaceirubra]
MTDGIAEWGRELARAWERGDATAYADAFTEDAEYVVFDGRRLSGRREIEDAHRWLFSGPLKGSRLVGTTEVDVPPRFLRPDVAVLVSGGAVAGPDGGVPAGAASVQTSVLVREDGRWRCASFQNTRVTFREG